VRRVYGGDSCRDSEIGTLLPLGSHLCLFGKVEEGVVYIQQSIAAKERYHIFVFFLFVFFCFFFLFCLFFHFFFVLVLFVFSFIFSFFYFSFFSRPDEVSLNERKLHLAQARSRLCPGEQAVAEQGLATMKNVSIEAEYGVAPGCSETMGKTKDALAVLKKYQ